MPSFPGHLGCGRALTGSLLGSVPTYPCLSIPLSGPLTEAKSTKGLLAILVSLWAVLCITGLPRLREQFLTPSLPQNNRRSPGRDINVTGVWERNVTGRGVTVVVVDDGVEHTIQDIAPNYVSGPGVSPAPWSYLILDVASGLFPFPVTSHWARGKGLGGRMLLFICSSPPGSLVPGS